MINEVFIRISLGILIVFNDLTITWGLKNTLPLAAVENFGH